MFVDAARVWDRVLHKTALLRAFDRLGGVWRVELYRRSVLGGTGADEMFGWRLFEACVESIG